MIINMTSKTYQIADTRDVETHTCAKEPAFNRDVFVDFSQRSGKFTLIERTWKKQYVSVGGRDTEHYMLINVSMVKLSKNGKLPYTESAAVHEAYNKWIEAGRPEDFVCVW